MNNENKRGRKAKEIDHNNIFAVCLRNLLEETESKQQDVADNIGVSRQALNKWVNGETVPDIFSAAKLADYFNVSTDYMTGRTDIKSKNEDIQTVCKVTGLSEKAISELNYFKDIPKIKNENSNFYTQLHTIMFLSFIAILDTNDFTAYFYNSDSEYAHKYTTKEIMEHAKDAVSLFSKYYHNAEENYRYIEYDIREKVKKLNEISLLLDKLSAEIKGCDYIIDDIENNPEINEEVFNKLKRLLKEFRRRNNHAQHNPKEE